MLDTRRLIVKKINFDARITEASQRHRENTFDLGDKNKEKIQKLNLSYFIGKNYFDDDEPQDYLILFNIPTRLSVFSIFY